MQVARFIPAGLQDRASRGRVRSCAHGCSVRIASEMFFPVRVHSLASPWSPGEAPDSHRPMKTIVLGPVPVRAGQKLFRAEALSSAFARGVPSSVARLSRAQSRPSQAPLHSLCTTVAGGRNGGRLRVCRQPPALALSIPFVLGLGAARRGASEATPFVLGPGEAVGPITHRSV